MKIEIHSFNVPILTEVISCLEFNTMKHESPIRIFDVNNVASSSFEKCVRIVVDGYREIWYYINDHSHGIQDIKILLPENSNTVFIGGKSKSIVVDLMEGVAHEEFIHGLFWDFKITPNKKYILDEGEISCLVRDLDGRIINEVSVEPPYESEYVYNGILYKCDGYTGNVLLEFDRSNH